MKVLYDSSIRKKIGIVFAMLFVIVLTTAKVQAATITSKATGGAWATAGTWVGGVVPTTTDAVVIATTGASVVTVEASATCAGLTINNWSILTVGAYSITVNGSTSITGTINFTSASGTKTFNGALTLCVGDVNG